jgi:tetratricopeptide (TPR) repeat protein
MSRVLVLKILIVVLLILAIPAAFFGYQARTNSTSYLLAKGNEAVERLDGKEVERIRKILENKGQNQAAYLIWGKFLVYAGQVALKQAPPAPPFEEMQQAGQMVLGGAGLSDQAPAARQVIWMMASSYQMAARVSSPALNRYRAALAELAKIQDDGSIGVEGTVLAAECLFWLDEKRLAAEGLLSLVKHHPDNVVAHRLLSAIYIDLNSPGTAIKHLREWARLDPAEGRPYRWIGQFLRDNNQQGEAIQAYQEALKRDLNPDMQADAIKELAEIYLQSEGKPENALETIALGTEAFQSSPDILALRVEALASLGRTAEGRRLVEQAFRDNPNNPKILGLRAQDFIDENKPDQALPLLEKAVQFDPYDLRAQTRLLNTYGQLQKKEQAAKQKLEVDEVAKIYATLSDLIQKARNSPWDGEVRAEIGAIYLKMNRPEEARTWLQAALACNPNHSKARRLLARLPSKEKVARASEPVNIHN